MRRTPLRLVSPALCIAVALLVLAFAHRVSAAERVALVIGNAQYSDPRARLANPVNDARDLSRVLATLGFEVITSENARKEVMNAAIREFTSRLEGAKVAVFFYAGHAVQLKNNNYLLPVDVAVRSVRDVVLDGVELAKVVNLMASAGTTNFVIVDACRDNPFRDGLRAAAGLADLQIDPRDTLVVYSAGPNRIAWDGEGRNSVFSKHLIRLLPEPEDDALLTFQKVQRAVERETANMKPPQIPFLVSSLRGFTFIPKAAKEAATFPLGQRESPPGGGVQGAGPSPDAQLNAERVYWESLNRGSRQELELYLSRYPEGVYAEIARARIADLAGARPQPPGEAGRPPRPSLAAAASSPQPSQSAAPPPAPAQATPQPAASRPDAASARPPVAGTKPEPVLAAPVVTRKPQPPPAQVAVAQPEPAPAPPPVAASRPQSQPPAPQAAAAKPQPAQPLQPATPKAPAVASSPERAPAPPSAGPPRPSLSVGAPSPALVASAQPVTNGMRSVEVGGARADTSRPPPRDFVVPGQSELIRYSDGSTFRGTLSGGKPHGTGELVLADNYRYRGEFRDGLRQGYGQSDWPNGDSYDGEFAAGLPHGVGHYRYANGDVYEGEFRSGLREGRGTLRTRQGDHYEGSFAGNVANGRGEFRFANGDAYQGDVSDGVIQGRGIFRSAAGDRFEGDFSAGRPHGFGVFGFANGDRYEGQVVNGIPDGIGVYTNARGDIYNGTLKQGRISGEGTYRFRSGARYVGEILDGKPNGIGVYHFVDGSRFEGKFLDGLTQATGRLVASDGSIAEAEIVEGNIRVLKR